MLKMLLSMGVELVAPNAGINPIDGRTTGAEVIEVSYCAANTNGSAGVVVACSTDR